ncbi:MAG TPA: hypothetical protein VF594_08915 [Rubricoccaceae bacterium]|jgi:hypothetical protein
METLPPALPLTRAERTVVALDAVLGVLLTGLGVLFVALGISAWDAPPHGGGFEILGALLVGPPGLLLLLAAVGVARRWHGRWWLHALPLLWLAVLFAVGLGGGLLR